MAWGGGVRSFITCQIFRNYGLIPGICKFFKFGTVAKIRAKPLTLKDHRDTLFM